MYIIGVELSDNEIRANRERIIELIKSIPKRVNTHKLLYFLDHSGYYYLYGSFKHHTYKGGLAQHSLEVMDYALENNKTCSRESIILAALLHDLCKTKYEFPEGVEFHGHGTKSVAIIDEFIQYPLSEEEHNAIRYHMGSKSAIRTKEDEEKYAAARNSELWELIHVGDCISAGDYSRPMHKIVKNIITFGNL